jgi:hypothetical protein
MPSPASHYEVPLAFKPWLWLGVGVAACLTALVWSRVAPESPEPPRLTLVWCGLLAAGVGVVLRFRSDQPSSLARVSRLVQTALTLLFGLSALAVSVNLVASWNGDYLLGLRPGLALVVWLFVTPLNALAAWQCLRRSGTAPLERTEETSVSLIAGGITAFLAAAALASDDVNFGNNWYTMQRFLLVLGLAALFAAPLVAVDLGTRRAVVSGLILFHFGGIVIAVLGHPPTPWIVNQVWHRIYRPYFQFMYLSNAYHFYSPEPGPPSYLWFRMFYDDADGKPFAHWYKIPRLDDSGRHGHTTSLEYQRTMSITENTIQIEVYSADSPVFQKLAARRLAATPDAQDGPIGGQGPLKPEVLVPMNPAFPKIQQFAPPQDYIKRYLQSFARHVIQKHQAQFPGRTYTSVRIYRVVHRIIPQQFFFAGLEPTDPEFYTPIYFGEYDPEGTLHHPDDPLLYWQLPILRDKVGIVDSPIRDWARRHAGDPYWIREVRAGFPVWVDDDGRPAPE